MANLQDQVVIVTGAGWGVGRVTALRCAAEGAKLALVDLFEAEISEVANEIRSTGGTVLEFALDIANRVEIETMVDAVEDKLGSINLLVNCAVRAHLLGSMWELDCAKWPRDTQVNRLALHLTCNAVLPGMIERDSGYIINFLGCRTIPPRRFFSHYNSNILGVIQFTEALARKASPSNIKMYAVSPTLLDTSSIHNTDSTHISSILSAAMRQLKDVEREKSPALTSDLVIKIAEGEFDSLSGRTLLVNSASQSSQGQVAEDLANYLIAVSIEEMYTR